MLLFESALLRCRFEVNFFCRVYMEQMVFSGYTLIRTLMKMKLLITPSSFLPIVSNTFAMSVARSEQDIAAAAEKLAECQQTILVLGKQLKALGAPNEAVELRTTEESPLSYKMSPSSHRLRSSSDRALSQSDVSDEMPYCSTEDRRASAVLGWSRAAKERRQEQGSIRSSRTNFAVNSPETEPGLGDRRGLSSERHGRQANPELHRGNSFPSPTHGDSQEGASLMTGYAMEAAVSSPLRSPARFLSLRNKNSNTQHGDSEPAEKHGSGFSRFFVRTKSGH